MGSKPKLKKVVHKVKKQPKLKKKIAQFLAEDMIGDLNKPKKLVEIAMYGYRGLLAESEDSLCKKFDILYEKAVEINKKATSDYNEKVIESNYAWAVRDAEDKMRSTNKTVMKMQEIYNEIFEEIVF